MVTSLKKKAKPLKLDELDATMEKCSARENPIYYALRGRHCYKHTTTTTSIRLMKGHVPFDLSFYF